ncbi:13010_t:CDS:1, partial [Acaulospora morrowiae]
PPIPADDLPNQSATISNSYSSVTSGITPSSTASVISTSTKSSNANRIRNGVAGISVIVGVLGCFIGMKLL